MTVPPDGDPSGRGETAQPRAWELFEPSLTLFHRYSIQNHELVRQLRGRGILPATRGGGFAALDIGAGQGLLPRLLAPLVDRLVLVEPNLRCVELLRRTFPEVHAALWDVPVCSRIHTAHPDGFALVTMSHMLYHLDGLEDVRAKVRLALALLRPGGHLAVVLNQRSAPPARIGIRFQELEGRGKESATNQGIHGTCHEPGFWTSLAGPGFDVELGPVDGSLHGVPDRAALVELFRMPLLDPLSEAPCDLARIDAFVASELDALLPDLSYPATIPISDDLVLLRRRPG